MTNDEYLDFLTKECHYLGAKILPDGRWAAISRTIYTCDIIVGTVGDMAGYSDRWCYETYIEALIAMLEWTGEGEPERWFRHPSDGRRIAREGNEYDEDGNPVAIGQEYVRW